MAKNNVTKLVKEPKKMKQMFTYQVTMTVHVIDDDVVSAKAQLDEKGGIVTKRDVQLLNSAPLFGEKEED
jgi:hypothetical protein